MTTPTSWRDRIKVHPAADLFPMMSPDELKTLGEDIAKHGLQSRIAVLCTGNDVLLLDGRNRMDAMEAAGLAFDLRVTPRYGAGLFIDGHYQLNMSQAFVPVGEPLFPLSEVDPCEFVLSANVHRRHLTAEQKRELIAKVLKAQPEKSNRQVAEQVKASHHTVGAVRAELQSTGQVAQLERTFGKDGKARTTQPERRGLVTGVATHPYAERGPDLYETPAPATRALLKQESFEGTIWECANGRGAISRVLHAAGYRVVATDLEDYGITDAQGGVDFLATTAAPEGVTTILTNPPFKHAGAFVRHALSLAPRVVMLQRLAFLESMSRCDILDGGQLARVYVFRNRLPMMHRDGWEGPHDSSAVAFVWMVWDRAHRGPAELHRISWEGDDASPTASADPIPEFLRRGAP